MFYSVRIYLDKLDTVSVWFELENKININIASFYDATPFKCDV
jgi:hypothetical protein